MFSKVRNWFHNYWYYYKWGVIVVGSFAIILTICLVQCASKEKYDVRIMYTGPHIFEIDEKEALSDAFEQIMDDYNGDGKISADIMDITAFTDAQIEEANPDKDVNESLKYAPYRESEVKSKFSSAVSGDGYICLVDKHWYDKLKANNALVPLHVTIGYVPDNAIDEYSLYLSDLEFYNFFSDSVGKLPEDTILCFRVMPAASSLMGKEAKKIYNDSKKLFCAIIEFDPEY